VDRARFAGAARQRIRRVQSVFRNVRGGPEPFDVWSADVHEDGLRLHGNGDPVLPRAGADERVPGSGKGAGADRRHGTSGGSAGGRKHQIAPDANLHIITGAPGTGKTAILSGLRRVGRCVGEPAREVLAEQRAAGGDGIPDRNPSRFVDLLLQRSIEKHGAASDTEGVTLFDRGIPDCVAYAEWLGTDPEPSVAAAALHRYNPRVLVARPWEDIYGTDDERQMTFEATVAFHRLLERGYANAGYTLVEIPRGSIQDRAAFVAKILGITLKP